MATSLKYLAIPPRVSPPQMTRVLEKAGSPEVMEAHRWLVRERSWINEAHLELCRIPAPTFFEAERAAFVRDRIGRDGWSAALDRAGNVVANFGVGDEMRPLVISAHLDTVFAPKRHDDVALAPDGRLLGPGVSDNGAGLAALLTLSRLLVSVQGFDRLRHSITLVANVGEEGEGNLSGMRYLCRQPARLRSVAGFIVLDGPSIDHITAQALGSQRFEVLFQGPGGHSWNDSGIPNPSHALANAISYFSAATEELPAAPRFSFNFGILEAGASINSIPAEARAKLDLRSEDSGVLGDLTQRLNLAVERALEKENGSTRLPRTTRMTARVRDLGSRPGGRLHPDSALLRTLLAVDQHLSVRSRIDCASTDANVPLSLGLPAVSIGTGGNGGGAHTPLEWYSPEGRELGLQRLLLLLSALVPEPGR